MPTIVPANVSEVGDKVTAGTVPVPLSVTFCGDPAALSAMFIVAEAAPDAAALKLTVIVQVPFTATLVPHELVCENAVALVPEKVMAVAPRVSAAVPVLVSVTGSVAVFPTGVPGKVSAASDRVTAGAVPFPLNVTCCGDPAELSAIFSVAVCAPAAAGLKVKVILQFAFAATLVPQVLVCENEAALVPAIEIAPLASVSAALPVLLSVTVWVAADEPTAVSEKPRLVGERPAIAPVPVPLSETAWGEPAALSAMLTEPVTLPIDAGLKVTVIAHVPLAATLVVQVLVCVKELSPLTVTAGLFHVSAAVPELVTVIFCVAAVEPTAVPAKVRLAADRVTAGAGASPVPVSPAVCGEPLALSATLTTAASEPTAVGVNLTVMTQLAPAATLVPQVFVWEKELALAPPMLMPSPVPLRVRAPVPVFFKVTVWVAADVPVVVPANVRLAGVKVTAGAVPVPLNVAVCGDPLALSATFTAAVCEPDAAGVNLTAMVQLAPAATLVPHVLVWENDPAFVPVMLMPCPAPFNVSAAVPVFLRVMLCAADVAPTAVLASVKLDGVKLTAGALATAVFGIMNTTKAKKTDTVKHRVEARISSI